MCIWSACVYVTDNRAGSITIFTTEGEYVTSFGQRGKEDGGIHHPWGACVDKDGFVYVCDAGNSRLQVF